MEKVLTKNDFFYCYSKNLKEFLVSNGMTCLFYGRNATTQNICWMFQRCELLTQLLNEWKETKPDHQ